MDIVDGLLNNYNKMKTFSEKKHFSLKILNIIIKVLEQKKYTEEQKLLLVDFIQKGLFDKIIEIGLIDSEIRKKVFEIQKHYRWKSRIAKKAPELGNFLSSINEDSITIKIKELMNSNIEIEQKDKILSDWMKTGFRYNNHSNILSLVKIVTDSITLKELRQTKVYEEVLKELKKDKASLGKKDMRAKYAQGRIKNVKNYIEDYLLKALLNGEELNFENDELLKEFPELQEKYKQYEEYSISDIDNILNSTKENLPEKQKKTILVITQQVLDIISKSNYSEQDKDFIKLFIQKGFFERIIEIGLVDSDIRKNVFEIQKHYKWKNKIEKKAPELRNFLSNINGDIIDRKIEEIINSNIEIEQKDLILSDWMKSGLKYNNQTNILNLVKIVADSITIKELRQTKVYKEVLKELKRDKNSLEKKESRAQYASLRINNVEQFIESYLLKALLNREELDLENDELLKEFPDLYEEYKDVLITPKQGEDVLLETLIFINDRIVQLIEKAHEISNYIFSNNDKELLAKYFENYYQISINKFPELEMSGHIEIFKQLTNVYQNGFDISETIEYFVNVFDCKNYEKVLTDNANSEDVLTMLARLYDNSDISEETIDIFLKYISEKEAKNENPYEIECITKLIENIIGNYVLLEAKDRDKIKSLPKQYEIIINYIDTITKQLEFNVINEQSVSDILQLMYSNRFPEEVKNKIEEILEKNLKLSEIDVKFEKNNLDSIIEKNVSIKDEETLDRFIEHLGRIKLKERRINNEYINFIIKQVLNKESIIYKKPEKYISLIERVIEDLGRNDLSSKISQDNYCYFIRDYLVKNSIKGRHYNNRAIFLKREFVLKIIKNRSLDVLSTLFHENTHARQGYEIHHQKGLNYFQYLMLKEKIIRIYNNDFYRKNYSYMFVEIEAREQGASKLISFLNRIIQTLPEESKISCFDLQIQGMFKDLFDMQKKEQKRYEDGLIKIDTLSTSEQKREVELIFEDIIKNHPDILKNPKYSLLLLEFNQDGSKKRISEVLQEIEKENGKGKLHLYRNIFKSGNFFSPDNFVEDLKFLINFENKDKRSYIINFEILRKFTLNMIEKIDQIPKEQLNDYINIINELNVNIEVIRRKPETDKTYKDKKILMLYDRTDKERGKSLIEILSDIKLRLIEEGKVNTPELGKDISKNDSRKNHNIDNPNNDNDKSSKTDNLEMDLFLEAEAGTINQEKAEMLKELITRADKKHSTKDNSNVIPEKGEDNEHNI